MASERSAQGVKRKFNIHSGFVGEEEVRNSRRSTGPQIVNRLWVETVFGRSQTAGTAEEREEHVEQWEKEGAGHCIGHAIGSFWFESSKKSNMVLLVQSA